MYSISWMAGGSQPRSLSGDFDSVLTVAHFLEIHCVQFRVFDLDRQISQDTFGVKNFSYWLGT